MTKPQHASNTLRPLTNPLFRRNNRMAIANLTPERLKSLLHYNEETGIFTRLVAASPRVKAGDICTCLDSDGYIMIRVDWKRYKAHRLAWFYTHGVWPNGQIDHINGERHDNRIENLRDVSPQGNQHNRRKASTNNASGFLGVRFYKGSWRATICIAGNNIHIGTFSTQDAAYSAYLCEKRKLHETCTI